MYHKQFAHETYRLKESYCHFQALARLTGQQLRGGTLWGNCRSSEASTRHPGRKYPCHHHLALLLVPSYPTAISSH